MRIKFNIMTTISLENLYIDTGIKYDGKSNAHQEY
jgi:hypothetical protein